ncbi:MAG: hypothetical protein ACREQN_01220 [Candidatus Binataceae bacterium]
MHRKGPKRRRQGGAMLLVVALAIAVLILGFLIRRITQPAAIRYVVPRHPRPATVVAPPRYSPDGVAPPQAAGADARSNGSAALVPPRAGAGVASNPASGLRPRIGGGWIR